MAKDEKKTKKSKKTTAEKVTKKEKKVSAKKTQKPAKAKREKKPFEIPAVVRYSDMVDIQSIQINEDAEAPERVKSLTKKDLRYLLDLHNSVIFGHVASGGKVQFMPLITYQNTVRLPRKGRNPKTGEPIDIAGSIGFSARAGKGLKELLNSNEVLKAKLLEEKKRDKAEKEAAKAAREAAKAAESKPAKSKRSLSKKAM